MIQVLASYLLLMIFKCKQYTNCLDRIICNKNSIHEKLTYLYKAQENWFAVLEHSQYVFENSKFEHDRKHAIKLIKLGQEKLNKKCLFRCQKSVHKKGYQR